jgi:uncharacterized membrane protein HdeD (DUF308 family)
MYRVFINSGRTPALWWAPAFLGVLLILAGVVIFIKPEIIAYILAAILVMGGISLIGSALRMRRGVTYRRIDEQYEE